jgi:four helix bundle protein
MKITRFEDIEAWQLARDLTRRIYRLVQEPKFSKDYGLRDQISRASVSIMANIAEGFNAGSNAEFVRFLGYAQRSCAELQSHLYVALDQNYIGGEIFNEMYELVNKATSKVGAFIKYLKQCKTKNEERGTRNSEQRSSYTS